MEEKSKKNPSSFAQQLETLQAAHQLRVLPQLEIAHQYVTVEGEKMLNLSSNDYLGLATNDSLRNTFMEGLSPEKQLFSSSSSRLLTGNFAVYDAVERLLAQLFGAESALVFNSGYHMNLGILPAISTPNTLILADKLVHASIIDGIRLSAAKCIRYRHNQYEQLAQLLERYHTQYERILLVTESIFSMDGDEADLLQLVALKKQYNHVLLYVDEAHAFGVRGKTGLGCVEEKGCIDAVDFIAGTFGKAAASVGAYVICSAVMRSYLINHMRPFIFTTALPPINMEWTHFIVKQMATFTQQRQQLEQNSAYLRAALLAKTGTCISTSHIIPILLGESEKALMKAAELRRKGFYILPVRPPTVPEGTARLRISMSPHLTEVELQQLVELIIPH